MQHSTNLCAFVASGYQRLLVQSTSVGVLMLIQGTVLPPITRAPIQVHDLTFLPLASAPILFPGAEGSPASMQSAALPLMEVCCCSVRACLTWRIHGSSYLAHVPSFLPWPQMAPSSTLSEHELLTIQHQELAARELEVERRTQALDLNASRDVAA